MAKLLEGSSILKPTGEEQIATLNDISTKRKGRLLTSFGTDWALWFGTVTHDTINTKVGSSSVKVSSDAANTTAAARLRSAAFDFRSYKNIMLRFYVHDFTNLSKIELRLSSVDAMTTYMSYSISKWKMAPGWNEIMIPLSKFTTSNGESLDNTMVTLQVSVTASTAGEVTSVSFDGLYVNLNQKGLVQIHFDDAFASVHANAFPILREKGMVGSIGVISGSVGTTNYMTLDQLKTLQVYGWGIFNHTATHQDLSTLTKEQIESQLADCKNWLDSNGFTESSDYVAYPYGGYNDTVLEVMQNYRFGRSTREEFEVLPPIQPYTLKVVSVTRDLAASVYQAAIDHVAETGDTVTFLFHKVSDTGTDTDTFTVANFRTFVEYLDSKRDSIEIVTCREWADEAQRTR